MEKNKTFQDTVHGYITIPSKYCEKIIDTIHFQRLRRIEQTSMRSIFPCARHDRFVHSLGTFFIGDKIFKNVKHNSYQELSALNESDWDLIGNSYKLACLLHDCGHAPFSHTFEKYYDKQKDVKLNDLLKREAQDERFSEDIDCNSDAKEHEKVSALILLKIYQGAIKDLGADPVLSARMILGCRYINDITDRDLIANCFINLLNGNIIDADRLDYIKRDKWASGYNSTSLDIEKLLSSICIKKKNEDEYVVCFLKNAISEIPNVLESRAFQSSWVFSHHKVSYDQHILNKAVEKLATILNPSIDKEAALSILFNVESFFSAHDVGGGHSVYLPSDDDIIHLLKCYIQENRYAIEWFSRQHSLKPVWKSFAEFNSLFKEDVKHDQLNESGLLDKNSDKAVKKILTEQGKKETEFHKEIIKYKHSGINYNDIYIFINNKIMSYDMLVHDNNPKKTNPYFFYLFVPDELIKQKQNLVKKMIALAR